jgi:SAM-dependent methyltransferase
LHARQWSRIGPPLRPAPEDVEICEVAVRDWSHGAGRPPRALLLGVTPELAAMRWPDGTSLLAVDRSEAMIGAVFPASRGSAVLGEWLALPCADTSIDWIVGDGCASTSRYPTDYVRLAAELRRVLAPDGELVLRLFAAPDEPEPVDAIARDLAMRRIESFHALKWRIAMAIQPPDRNVQVVDIWRTFEQMAPDREALARSTGWSADTIATIDAYCESDVCYSFPTLGEVRRTLTEFIEVACHVPSYELGDRCPTLVLCPR